MKFAYSNEGGSGGEAPLIYEPIPARAAEVVTRLIFQTRQLGDRV